MTSRIACAMATEGWYEEAEGMKGLQSMLIFGGVLTVIAGGALVRDGHETGWPWIACGVIALVVAIALDRMISPPPPPPPPPFGPAKKEPWILFEQKKCPSPVCVNGTEWHGHEPRQCPICLGTGKVLK